MPEPPLCFVVMPFGTKPDGAGGTVDFDAVYRDLLAPAVEAADLEPLRADQELAGGLIHKPMFERLVLCEFAVADLTTANANVFYELGVRHAIRPATTVLLFADGGRLPFDVAPLRALPYRLAADGRPAAAAHAQAALAARLEEARRAGAAQAAHAIDSPLFQLVDSYPSPEIAHIKTDVFRERVDYSRRQKDELARARKAGRAAVEHFEATLGPFDAVESGVLVDLFLSYRAVKAWDRMIDLAARLPRPLTQTVLVREQLALALNRAGSGDEAVAVLDEVLASRGRSSETYGILGRVYKDRYERAKSSGDAFLARGELQKATETYLKGFECDWRDAFLGINAVTLMELMTPPDPRQAELIPLVRYAVARKLAAGGPDYWDHATLLELAVIEREEAQALAALTAALPEVREVWEPETTLRNLALIVEARRARGEATPSWLATVTGELAKKAAP